MLGFLFLIDEIKPYQKYEPNILCGKAIIEAAP
jgi:hypothetical protein